MSTDAQNPPFDDGPDYEPIPCNRCGAELEWVDCQSCGGEGGRDEDDLMEEDPLWYDGVEWERCDDCRGEGGWLECPALPHREETKP